MTRGSPPKKFQSLHINILPARPNVQRQDANPVVSAIQCIMSNVYPEIFASELTKAQAPPS